MSHIVLVHPDGHTQQVAASDGQSLMQLATRVGVPGIVAECGGSAMCATCHVYVAPAWVDRLPAPSSTEEELLACTASPRRPGSRLSCQIVWRPALAGLTVELPERQQ